MKNLLKYTKLLIAVAVTVTIMVSCEYQEVADAKFPEQVIYMPTATFGIYKIDTAATAIGEVPTPGNSYRYKIEQGNNKFIVPLGVYRSGANNEGSFTVNIVVNTDTITKLINDEQLSDVTAFLPSDKYSIVSEVNMPDGTESALFNLEIDLGWLKSNPDKIYAIGIGINSEQRKTNPKLSTTIVLIKPKFIQAIL